MPQSLASVLVHLVFSTKHRQPLICPEIEPELHPYLATVFRSLDSPTLTINGTQDHVHVLFRLGRKISLAKLVEEVKTSSSKWIKTKGPAYKGFHWQNGYGAFSIGQSGVEVLKRYIANQKSITGRQPFKKNFGPFWPSIESTMTSGMCGIRHILLGQGARLGLWLGRAIPFPQGGALGKPATRSP